MTNETAESSGFGVFGTIEEYLEHEDDLDMGMMKDLLSDHLEVQNIRQTDIATFISHVENTASEEKGVEWLGNPFVVCTGGIKRSPLTRQYLNSRTGKGQVVVNNELPATSMKGFNALELPNLAEYLARLGEEIVTLERKTELNTIIFHMSPPEDLSPAMSLVQLVKLLNEINRDGEKLNTKLLLVIDDEYTISEAYGELGIKVNI